jgi:hypothetical protein
MSERQQLIDRILKLLALAEGTSFDAEAATARGMAEKLIAKHNISLADSDKDQQEYILVPYKPWSATSLWERIIATEITHLCACDITWKGDENVGHMYRFIGTRANTEAALYIASQISIQRQRAWQKYKMSGGTDSFGKFCFSFARGLEVKINQLMGREQIAEIKRIRLWFEARESVHTTEPIRGQGSSSAGKEAGSSASIYRGQASSPTPIKRITHESK